VLALSAFDMALWDLKARRAKLPLYRLLGGNDRAGAVLCRRHRPRSSVKDLLAQTDGNLKKGFRAIKTKVGRDLLHEDVERIRAMRKHLATAFR
jgi:L-alanine-DL-glutamate epimerase-like enolase superfamily enzyme